MKITAEFNSNEELLSFIGTFGTKGLISSGVTNVTNISPVVETKKTVKGEIIKTEDKPIKEVLKEEIKENVATKDAETTKGDATSGEPKITKEMIRERLGLIMKTGKQKEAKDLLAKYSASKLPELKEEHYAAVYGEAEGLL